jgi:methionyl-tRNA formyltransferase
VRVGVYSMILPAVQGLVAGARALGLEPVAVIAPRAPEGDVERGERAQALLDGASRGLDLCFADTKASLARLTHAYEPDLGLCLGYPWLLPEEVLAIPALGVVNGHPSLLPRHRGPFPWAWMIREGDEEVGMTFHLMDADFDTGPILSQGSRPLPADTSLPGLLPTITALNEELLPRALDRLLRGDRGDPQTDDGATYAGPFGADYLEVDLGQTAVEIDRQVRAWAWMFAPPGAQRGPLTTLAGSRVRLVRTTLTDPQDPAAQRLEAADAPLWVLEYEPA